MERCREGGAGRGGGGGSTEIDLVVVEVMCNYYCLMSVLYVHEIVSCL